MKFNVIIDRWEIFYFFVETLALSKTPFQKSCKNLWQKEIGNIPLGRNQELEKFIIIHKKYHLLNSHLMAQFNKNKSLWRIYSSEVNEKDLGILNSVFNNWNSIFNKFYEKEFTLLQSLEKAIEKYFLNKKLILQILKILSTLYYSKKQLPTVKIFLLPSTKTHTRGSMIRIKNKSPAIYIYISRYPLGQSKYPIGIIFHELIHAYFERPYFMSLIRKHFRKEEQRACIREVVCSTLFPYGVLAQKYFGIPPYKLRANIPSKYTTPFLKLTSKYIKGKKPFDEKYLKTLYLLVEPYMNKKF